MRIVLEIIGWALVIIAIIAKLGSKKLRWRDASITAVLGIIVVVIGSSIGSHGSQTSSRMDSLSTAQQDNVKKIQKDYNSLTDDINRINQHKGATTPVAFLMGDIPNAQTDAQDVASSISPSLKSTDGKVTSGTKITADQAYRALAYNFQQMTTDYLNAFLDFNSSGANKTALTNGQVAATQVSLDLSTLGVKP